jgi:xylulokinase
VARRDGRRHARISDFTDGVVAVNEATRCVPHKENVQRYRALQLLQDEMSLALRASGVFARHRSLAARQGARDDIPRQREAELT